MFDRLSTSEAETVLLCMEVREDIFQSLVALRRLRYKKTSRHVQPLFSHEEIIDRRFCRPVSFRSIFFVPA